MSELIRFQILSILLEHHKSGSSTYKDDKAISKLLSLPLQEAQDQLDILEGLGHVKLAKAMGPSYAAIISSQGILHLEETKSQIEHQEPPRKKAPIGFKRD
jgi:hypothetical protein